MTEQPTEVQDIVRQLAALIPKRDAAVRILEEMEAAFQAEAADLYTREKHLKLLVEDLKTLLRTAVTETGEKAPGVTLAHTQAVSWEGMEESEVVAWCCTHAPQLLTLRGTNEIRKWFFQSPIQTTNINGKPSAIYLVEQKGEDGNVSVYAVPCPFHLTDTVQVRISESGIVTEVGIQQWEEEHGKDIQG